MPASWNGTSFWTAVFGLIAATITLVATVAGLLGTLQGGTPAGGHGVQPAASAVSSATATQAADTASASPVATPALTRSPAPSVEVESEGTLEIPVSEDEGEGLADIDGGSLIRAGGSDEMGGADIAVTVADGAIGFEPGTSGTEKGVAARFLLIGNDGDIDECATASRAQSIPDRLELPDLDGGGYVCMTTTEGRRAGFEIADSKLNGRERWIEIRFIVWASP
jgi:hypothetical protein